MGNQSDWYPQGMFGGGGMSTPSITATAGQPAQVSGGGVNTPPSMAVGTLIAAVIISLGLFHVLAERGE